MEAGLYTLIVALAAGATYFYLVREDAIGSTTLLAGGLWGIVAIRGGDWVVSNAPDQATFDAEPLQAFGLVMAIASFGAFLLWWAGEYPVEEDEVKATGEGAR